MATKKITLAFVILITAFVFQSCNSSHTTDNRRQEASGVNPQPASSPKSANGSTTAQGQTGADSVYQKGTQKSQK